MTGVRVGNRLRVAGVVVLTVTGCAVATLAALAGNAATGQERWPGALDLLRRHPWEATGTPAVIGVVLASRSDVRRSCIALAPCGPGPSGPQGAVVHRPLRERGSRRPRP
ncbi:hypothetical protein [Streptomyces macrosporus]|uniref:Uncharacterized protein n=1 Tax=Streptomyces macrosporus TaxID=44032 RepID=A0ABP5WA68_9ACTN